MLHSGSFTSLSSKKDLWTQTKYSSAGSGGAMQVCAARGLRGQQKSSNGDQWWGLALRGQYRKICNAFSRERLCQREENSTFHQLAALWSTPAYSTR